MNGKAVQLIFALLGNKQEQTYAKFFRPLLQIEPTLSPSTILVDFEIATINAIKTTFGAGIEIVACSFHLSRNLWRKIQQLHLTERYKDDADFRLNCKMLLALSYVPPRDIQFAFEIMAENFLVEMQPLVEYWENTYTGRRLHNVEPLFNIEMWNLFQRISSDLPKTNNSLEA